MSELGADVFDAIPKAVLAAVAVSFVNQGEKRLAQLRLELGGG